MKTDYFSVRGKWGVIICHDLHRLDEYEMRQSMIAFGMRGGRLDNAVDILLFHEDTGMCVSRDDVRMSLIFIGNTSSEEQFWDTVSHELFHAQQAILDYYDVPNDGESAAWTMGYLMRCAVQLLGGPCEER